MKSEVRSRRSEVKFRTSDFGLRTSVFLTHLLHIPEEKLFPFPTLATIMCRLLLPILWRAKQSPKKICNLSVINMTLQMINGILEMQQETIFSPEIKS